MSCLSVISNPAFQLIAGALISFGGSVVANYLFFGKVAKSRAAKETKRAYNKLMNRLVVSTISDINPPLHILPTDIADRIEDLKFTLTDVNPEFEGQRLVNKAIEQAVELRKQQQAKYPHSPPVT